MKVLSIANHKGGVGKTTSVLNIGAGLAKMGKRVLLVDLDPQANLTEAFGLTGTNPTVCDSLSEGVSALKETYIQNLSIIPSEFDLTGFEVAYMNEIGRESVLKSVLEDYNDQFDVCIIDTPPSLGLLTINALTASSDIIIPVSPELYSIQGIVRLIDIAKKVKRAYNPQLEISGIFITQYNGQKIVQRDLSDQVVKGYGDKVFKSRIRLNVALEECPIAHKDIFSYDPESNGAKDYESLCQEIAERYL